MLSSSAALQYTTICRGCTARRANFAPQTPTNTFGFLLYGAAAFAYHSAGVRSSQAVYDPLATEELARALASLRAASVPGEPNPATLRWNC